MIVHKEIEIYLNDDMYIETKGLQLYIDKEIRVTSGEHQSENYTEVINIL